jgi:hypothetical protein
MDVLISICVGVSLSASAGLRAFMPLFVAGLLARYDWLDLGDSFVWLSQTPALIALGVAMVVEMAADKIPALDHALDLVQGPVRTGAGMVIFGAVVAELPTWATALSAIVAGGGTAATVHATKSAVRVGSTATTGGVANPVLSIGEDLTALLTSVLSILVAVAAVIFAVVTLFVGVFAARRLVRWWRGRGAEDATPDDPVADDPVAA